MQNEWTQRIFFIVALGVIFYVYLPHLATQSVDKKNIVDCRIINRTYEIKITKNGFSPNKLSSKTCDRLVFKNVDSVYHQPAFGEHPYHLLYPDFNEKAIKAGSENYVILKAFGNYKIHDHINDNFEATLFVAN